MNHQSYFTRALRARDPRYARIFGKLGYRTTDRVEEASIEVAPLDINALRELYEQVMGKKPFNGWAAETLSAKIAEKRAEG